MIVHACTMMTVHVAGPAGIVLDEVERRWLGGEARWDSKNENIISKSYHSDDHKSE